MPAREADPDFDDAGRPSKSQRKRESHALQSLGEALATLSTARLQALEMPEALRDALLEYQRTRSHEGRRRQMQYIGRLMRGVDPAPLEEAVAAQRLGGAREALALHEAERWRDDLIARDEAVGEWLARYPDTDSQQLRSLVRQARKDRPAPDADAASRGLAPRQGRAYREIFQLAREQLAAAPANLRGGDLPATDSQEKDHG